MRIPVPDGLDGQRCDRIVAAITGLSRAEVAELVAIGAVRVNAGVASRSQRVRAGTVIEVDIDKRRVEVNPAPDAAVSFSVIYADEDIAVVDKPAGLVVHPGSGNRDRTLVSGLLARFGDLPSEDGEPERPGIVHRLDKGTSGLLVVARNLVAREALVAQLAVRTVERSYLCLVEGHLEADRGVIDAPIGRSLRKPTAMAVSAGGRPARTRYHVIARFGSAGGTSGEPATGSSLVECSLETGRTHQIRVHMASIGHPVVGDPRYGRKQGLPSLKRLFLHAHRLAFDHPADGRRMVFSSPLPADLREALAAIDGAVS